MRFPNDFSKTPHPTIPSATLWKAKKSDGGIITVIKDLRDGTNSYNMLDHDQWEEAIDRLSQEDINKLLEGIEAL